MIQLVSSVAREVEIKLRWVASYLIKTLLFDQKTPSLQDLEVLHISSNYVVVNKQWDIAVNTDTPDKHPVNVASQLAYKFPHLYDVTVGHGFRFCHRLDYSTSGVLCIALTKDAARHGGNAFTNKTAQKYYLALVHGHMAADSIVIDQNVGTDSRPGYSHRMCTSNKDYCCDSRCATTKLLVLERGLCNNEPATKVLLKLLTGRRHQLRVHCHELGHTIVGDYTYSDRRDLKPYRMFLHAFRLVLPTKIEVIDVCTNDPFTEHDSRNMWRPQETVHKLDSTIFCKL